MEKEIETFSILDTFSIHFSITIGSKSINWGYAIQNNRVPNVLQSRYDALESTR